MLQFVRIREAAMPDVHPRQRAASACGLARKTTVRVRPAACPVVPAGMR